MNTLSSESRGFASRWRRSIADDAVASVAKWVCIAFVGLALAAPLIASSRPFFIVVPSGAEGRGIGALEVGWSFPWFAALFDHRAYPALGDRTLNAVLVLLPIVCFMWRRLRTTRARLASFVVLSCVATLAGAVIDTSGPVRDYRGRIAKAQQDGPAISALFPPIAWSATEPDLETGLAGPSASHPCGTDSIGRDVAARLAFGARSALLTALLAAALAYAIGATIGALAGYHGGVVDAILGRVIDVVACLPFLVIVMAAIAFSGRYAQWHVVLICALFGWEGAARLVRAEMLRLREYESTLAARALGLPEWRIVARHLLPAALTPLFAGVGFSIASLMLVDATLSFLGLSDPTLPSWGQILRAGRDTRALHLILAPGILIFCVVTAINLLADVARAAIEPQRSRR
jgi:peptide/nickel transport system permease protein